jgi:cytochrome c oxidase cbb3-type subunit 1
MHPYYVSRAVGGLVYFIGAALGAYNIWKTISGGIASTADTASADALPVVQPAE